MELATEKRHMSLLSQSQRIKKVNQKIARLFFRSFMSMLTRTVQGLDQDNS